MCGIAGFAGIGGRQELERMTRALAHRGPDAEGFYSDESRRLFLGHRRLIVRDSIGGEQPMWNRSGTVGVVYNGEIYNDHELRTELTAAGHKFQSSHSDTEILIHGYEQWGDSLPSRLNGMFAFAIYDVQKARLFLARDRFGEKPLYYASSPGLFAFASEVSALTRHPAVSTLIDQVSLQKLFAYGYIPAPRALYQGVSKLPGGHSLTVDLQSLKVKIDQYWRFRLEPDEAMAARGEETLAEELRQLLIQAVGRRMVSDVPIGVFLSGGLDSSAVLAAAACHVKPESLRTFTIGFTEPSYDESVYARMVASHIGSSHHQRILDMKSAGELIPTVLDRLDEPLGDASILPTYQLSAFTREHVTVALSGDGGDELFAGYDPFNALRPAALYSRLVPRPLHNLLRGAAEHLPKSSRNMGLDFKIRRTLMGLSYPEKAWAPVWMAPVDPKDMKALFEEPLRLDDLYSEAIELWETGPASGRVDRMLQFFTQFYLQDDILTKVDRASMMSSLEVRAVFLDNDIVEFCSRLPYRFKYRNGQRKYILKKALEPMLLHDIIYRRKKGFGIPLAEWMRNIPARPPLAPVSGVRLNWAEQAWALHREKKADHRIFLWTWLSLQRTLSAASLVRQ